MASSIPSAGLPATLASNLTDFAGNVVSVISPYIPDAIKSNLNSLASSKLTQEMTKSWNWAAYSSLLVASIYVFDWGAKSRRDKRLRDFGSPPPLVPFKAPFGMYSHLQRCRPMLTA